MYTLHVFCCHQLQNCENERNTPGKYHNIQYKVRNCYIHVTYLMYMPMYTVYVVGIAELYLQTK